MTWKKFMYYAWLTVGIVCAVISFTKPEVRGEAFQSAILMYLLADTFKEAT